MKRVKFLKDYNEKYNGKKGKIASLSDKFAKELEEKGIVEILGKPKNILKKEGE